MTAPVIMPRRVPLVARLRSRPGMVIRMAAPDEPALALRVEMPEVWDVVRIEAAATEPVATVKERALEALYPRARYPEDFVMKLHGFEITNENLTVGEAGARSGSTFLLTHRRRRPVK